MKKIITLTFITLFIFTNSAFVSASGFSIITKKNTSVKQKIIVLMYHMISEVKEYQSPYCITPQELEADILYLKNNNFVFAFPDEIDKVTDLYPDKNIAVLTFDDGYESDYNYVLPLLKKHGVKASFFVFSTMLDKPFYMTKEQLKKLSESEYVMIGNHSYELHNKTPQEIRKFFSQNKISEIVYDFEKNKKELETITGKKITVLSYPNGIYSRYADNIMKNNSICCYSLSTEERRYSPYTKIIGRFNRSNNRTAEEILKIIK